MLTSASSNWQRPSTPVSGWQMGGGQPVLSTQGPESLVNHYRRRSQSMPDGQLRAGVTDPGFGQRPSTPVSGWQMGGGPTLGHTGYQWNQFPGQSISLEQGGAGPLPLAKQGAMPSAPWGGQMGGGMSAFPNPATPPPLPPGIAEQMQQYRQQNMPQQQQQQQLPPGIAAQFEQYRQQNMPQQGYGSFGAQVPGILGGLQSARAAQGTMQRPFSFSPM